MDNNQDYKDIATAIFNRLCSNFPTPVTLTPDDIFNDPDEISSNALKGTIAFLLHEKYIIALPSGTSFLLTEKGYDNDLCNQSEINTDSQTRFSFLN